MQRAPVYNIAIGADVFDYLLGVLDTRPHGEVKHLYRQFETTREQQDLQAQQQPAAEVVPIAGRQVNDDNAKGA